MSQPDFDVTTSRAAPLHPDEANRLRALRKTGALDSPSVPLLDQITKSAARLLNVEISLITLVDAERQWFLSRHGLKANETHRDFAFCSHALHAREIYTVEDASTHPTFRDNPLVTGDPFIRSYAGAVLRDLSGLPLGTLCVIGKEPRVFSDGELDILKELAKIVRRDILTIAARDQSEDSRRYDPVTGAFWGDSFYNAAKRLSSELGLQHGASIICSTTIENLSVIADTSGSSVTDRVIEDVGAKMQSVLESFGLTLLGRPDGKRIISKTVIDTEADPEKLDEVRAALMSAFSDGPALNEGGLTPRLVVAVAQRRTDLRLEDVVMMCRIASEETEKRDGVSSVVVTQSIERDVLARIRLTEDIGTALDKDQLHLEFQPKLNTRTQSVTGCECLIRWEHPTVGRVPADQIIDAARESFNIPKLDRWVTRQACKTAAQWTASGIAFESLSVNLCAETLLDPTFHGWFSECLKEENIDSKLIDFEIVESSFFTNIDVAIKAIYKLRRLGVTFSLDDFGTGFSSLSYLRQLPIDKIKIDRSFIDGVEREPDSAAMCASIVSVSHELGLRVIAEGIETELQLVTLRALRCDEVQGYFLSRPLPLTKATQFLLEHQAMPKHIKAG